MNRLRIAPFAVVQTSFSSSLRLSNCSPKPRQIIAFSTSSCIMAPPKAALDFIDFVNASPTRMWS